MVTCGFGKTTGTNPKPATKNYSKKHHITNDKDPGWRLKIEHIP